VIEPTCWDQTIRGVTTIEDTATKRRGKVETRHSGNVVNTLTEWLRQAHSAATGTDSVRTANCYSVRMDGWFDLYDDLVPDTFVLETCS
jgi:hypothetical protein